MQKSVALETQGRGHATVALYGHDHMAKIGAVGGMTTLDRYGREHFVRIANINPNKGQRLTPTMVREIRASTRSNRALALEYGVSHPTIQRVKSLSSYRDVE